MAFYISNQRDLYSQKLISPLRLRTLYIGSKFEGRRRTTSEERKVFGSPWIAVFKKRRG